jgi:hypothetical protein
METICKKLRISINTKMQLNAVITMQPMDSVLSHLDHLLNMWLLPIGEEINQDREKI